MNTAKKALCSVALNVPTKAIKIKILNANTASIERECPF